jgi:hypothetical protein
MTYLRVQLEAKKVRALLPGTEFGLRKVKLGIWRR